MMKYREKGAITVFLSLISAIFLSLICTVIESARIAGARAQAANIADMGNYSVFGEYEKKLLEAYEVFSVDGAYGTGDFSIDQVTGHLQSFLLENANPKKDGIAGLCFDPWNLQLNNSEITEYALLTDENGEPFYQQVCSFMKKTAVSGTVGKLFQYHHDAQTAQSKQEEYQRKKNTSDQEMAELEKQETQKKQELEQQKQELEEQRQQAVQEGNELVVIDPAPVEEVKRENPLKALNRLRKKSILQIVCGGRTVSSKKVAKKELCFSATRQKGSMKIDRKNSGLTCDLLFREYLLDHFQNYCSSQPGGTRPGEALLTDGDAALDYQLEYILGGKRGDQDNLKYVVNRLLLIREGTNYLYCIADSRMSAEAEGLATLLIGWTGLPVLIAIMKHALLLGWAYGESLLDVKTLMDGGKIPLLKSETSWVLTLENLGQINEILDNDGSDRQEGLAYRDYLRLLLNLQSITNQKKRGLEMLQLNIQKVPGLSTFKAANCVVGIKTTTQWTIPPVFIRVASAFLGVSQGAMEVTVNSGFAYD